MGIVVVEKKVSQSLLACKVEVEEAVENKTLREASEKEELSFVPAMILQDFTLYFQNSLEDK